MSVFEKLKSFIDKGVVEQTPYSDLGLKEPTVLKIYLKGSKLTLSKLTPPIGHSSILIKLDKDYICNLLSQEEKEKLFSKVLSIIMAEKFLKEALEKVAISNKLDSILKD